MNFREASIEINEICIKCGKPVASHPRTGRFGMIVLVGHECAWQPDEEFRDYVQNTLKRSGYDLAEFDLDKTELISRF